MARRYEGCERENGGAGPVGPRRRNNFGDCEPAGDGLSEMRVFVGPGYRISFVRTGITAYLMLWGSDKTDQKRGIKRAKEILDALRGQ